MSTFIGKYEAKVDAKGRIFVPAAYRKLLGDIEKDRIVMRKEEENNCLIFYPEAVWNQKIEYLKSKLDEWNSIDELLLMQFVADAEWLDIDTQGRILVSKKNLQTLGIENGEVVFMGMIDRFALWSKAHYEKARLSSDEFTNLLKEKLMKSE